MSLLVRAASLTNFSEVARAAGLNPTRMLADAGLSPLVLHEPDLRIPVDRVGRVLEASSGASGDESFGLRMAESRRMSNLGPVGLLMRDQPTVRHSLGVLLHYGALLNNSLSLVIEESEGVAVLREEVLVGEPRPVRQAIELALGVMVRLLRQLLGAHWSPRRVCFVHPGPRDLGTHLRVLGSCVEFNADFNGIVFARAELDACNPLADPAMARYAQQLLDASVVPQAETLHESVRRTILLLLPSGRCSIEQVSEHLGVVCRTVQRRLAERGQSFSSLLDDIRREIAARHVTESARPMAEVAAALGFASPSAFSRWYRSQFGCSPMQARAARPRHEAH